MYIKRTTTFPQQPTVENNKYKPPSVFCTVSLGGAYCSQWSFIKSKQSSEKYPCCVHRHTGQSRLNWATNKACLTKVLLSEAELVFLGSSASAIRGAVSGSLLFTARLSRSNAVMSSPCLHRIVFEFTLIALLKFKVRSLSCTAPLHKRLKSITVEKYNTYLRCMSKFDRTCVPPGFLRCTGQILGQVLRDAVTLCHWFSGCSLGIAQLMLNGLKWSGLSRVCTVCY